AMQKRSLPLICLVCLLLTLTACSIGPQYQRPTAPVPAAYKEAPPASFKEADRWKVAQPNDSAPRRQWWEAFGDPEWNALEEQVNVSNQTLVVAEAQLRSARAAIDVARTALFPTVTSTATVVGAQQSLNRSETSSNPSNETRSDYLLSLDTSYEID